jgi:hypothetical protein
MLSLGDQRAKDIAAKLLITSPFHPPTWLFPKGKGAFSSPCHRLSGAEAAEARAGRSDALPVSARIQRDVALTCATS